MHFPQYSTQSGRRPTEESIAGCTRYKDLDRYVAQIAATGAGTRGASIDVGLTHSRRTPRPWSATPTHASRFPEGVPWTTSRPAKGERTVLLCDNPRKVSRGNVRRLGPFHRKSGALGIE